MRWKTCGKLRDTSWTLTRGTMQGVWIRPCVPGRPTSPGGRHWRDCIVRVAYSLLPSVYWRGRWTWATFVSPLKNMRLYTTDVDSGGLYTTGRRERQP